MWKILLALGIAACVFTLIWLLRDVLLTPVPLGKNIRLSVVLRVDGAAPNLDRTVDALLWLIADGVLPADIVIKDLGMDSETRTIANLLARNNERVTVWTKLKNP